MGAQHASCDVHGARTSGRGEGGAHPRLVLATTILASSLAFVDGSVVNVGLPAIGRSLSAQAGELQWVVNAYLLPLSALLLLLAARPATVLAASGCWWAGPCCSLLASLGCTFASTLPLLLAGRLLQGVGRGHADAQ